MLRLYDTLSSGNGYKVRLLLHQLDIPYERIELDIDKAETRTPEFLARNPNGRVPVLEVEEGRYLPESNAILWYLAEGTAFLPEAKLARARVLQWLFFEQYSHEPNIATPRYWLTHPVTWDDEKKASLEPKRARGYAALGVMEQHLAHHDFFVANTYGIADIALYAYTHVAPEGGFSLDAYPALQAWLARVAAQDRHIPITHV